MAGFIDDWQIYTSYLTTGPDRWVMDEFVNADSWFYNARYNQPSDWEVHLANGRAAGLILGNPNKRRIDFFHGGVWIGGGRLRSIEHTVDSDGDWITVRGYDEIAHLTNRFIWVNPAVGATTPRGSYFVPVADAANTIWLIITNNFINTAAGGAAVGSRGSAWELDGTSTPIIGDNIKRKYRFDNAWDAIKDLVDQFPIWLNFRLRVMPDVASFMPRLYITNAPTNQVNFSTQDGSITAWTVELTAPEVTTVWVGGMGELDQRQLYGKTSADEYYWWRTEVFADRRDLTVGADMTQGEANAAMVEEANSRLVDAKTMIKVTPSAASIKGYGTTWSVGSMAQITLGTAAPVTDRIVEVRIGTTDDDWISVVPVVGAVTDDSQYARRILQLSTRVNQLESNETVTP